MKRKTVYPTAEELYRSIGQRARHVRKLRNFRQDEIAEMIALTRTSICNIESGKQRMLLHTVVDLAKALTLSPAYLAFGNELPEADPVRASERQEMARLRDENHRLRLALERIQRGLSSAKLDQP